MQSNPILRHSKSHLLNCLESKFCGGGARQPGVSAPRPNLVGNGAVFGGVLISSCLKCDDLKSAGGVMQARRPTELDSMMAVTTWCRHVFGRRGGIGGVGVGDIVSVSATGELKPEAGDLAKLSSADDCVALYFFPDLMSIATPTVRQPKWLGVTGEFWPDFGRPSDWPQTERPRPTEPPISDRDFRSRPS